MLSKVYKANPAERNYSPAEVSSTEVVPISDNPDLARIQRSSIGGILPHLFARKISAVITSASDRSR